MQLNRGSKTHGKKKWRFFEEMVTLRQNLTLSGSKGSKG